MALLQAAAIPYRQGPASELEVLLVTSRRGKRWVFPKGTVRGRPSACAAREAFEEAGILGVVSRTPVGIYRQRKTGADGSSTTIGVQAFALLVNTQLRSWPEMAFRQRRWMPISDAVDAVADPELRMMLQVFEDLYRQQELPE